MLPAAHRLRRSEDFRTALRARSGSRRLKGARAGGDLLVLHVVRRPDDRAAAAAVQLDPAQPTSSADSTDPGVPRVGFVVSKAVGNSVQRHRTYRVLRHLVRDRLAAFPADVDAVLRAQPRARSASTDQLGTELDRLLERTLGRL